MVIRIVTDSTCDLPAEIITRYGIQVVPLYINVSDQGFLDGIDIKRAEFYTRLPTFSTHPTTAVPSPQKFYAIYESLTDEGTIEILSIHSADITPVIGAHIGPGALGFAVVGAAEH